jgi:DNA polymerase III epsilon subunit-like protein
MALIEDVLAFVDTETSGLIPGVHRVLEVATILTTLDGREIDRFDARIQVPPDHQVSPEAAAINGYEPMIWLGTAVPFEEYAAFLKRYIPYGHVAVPVGHNVGFDRRMIHESHYGSAFCPLSYHLIDTVSLAGCLRAAGVIDTPNLKLTTVTQALGIEHALAHRAMSDCEAARAIFEKTVKLLETSLVAVPEDC